MIVGSVPQKVINVELSNNWNKVEEKYRTHGLA
jgi:hypothetical protein